MAKNLIQTTEIWRADTEQEAKQIIELAKKDSDLIKYSSTHKTQKSKGEIIQEWEHVSLTKQWDEEKEPCSDVTVTYNVRGGGWEASDEGE